MNSIQFPRGVELVSSAIIQKDNKILLTKSPKWSNKWTMPGGHVEPGESFFESVKREVLEETGLIIKPIKLLNPGELIGSKDFHRPAHFVYFDIICNAVGGKLKLQKKELSEYDWFTIREARKLDLAENFDTTLKAYEEFLAENS